MSEEFQGVLPFGDAKKAITNSGAKAGTISLVPIDNIKVMKGFNVRMDSEKYKEHLSSLATSIFEEGFFPHKPLAGFISKEGDEDCIFIKDGHTRLAAARIARDRGAPIQYLPVIIEKTGNIVDFNVELINANNGLPLTPFEKALVVKRLYGFGLSQTEIVRRTGITKTNVSDYLIYLFTSPPQVHDLIIKEKIHLSTALELIKRYREKAIYKMLDMIEKAEGEGKSKAGRQHMPDAGFKNFLRKKAPVMTNLITKINTNKEIMALIEQKDPSISGEIAELATEGCDAMDAMLNPSIES